MQITLTPAQLTAAQMGGCAHLNTGETLVAVELNDGAWKYVVMAGDIVSRVHYARPGLEAALAALNEEEGAE